MEVNITSMLGLAFYALEQVGCNREGAIKTTWLATDYRHHEQFGRQARLE